MPEGQRIKARQTKKNQTKKKKEKKKGIKSVKMRSKDGVEQTLQIDVGYSVLFRLGFRIPSGQCHRRNALHVIHAKRRKRQSHTSQAPSQRVDQHCKTSFGQRGTGSAHDEQDHAGTGKESFLVDQLLVPWQHFDFLE